MMNRLTSFVLRHKLVVVGFWLLATLVGLATLGSTTKRLSASFALPGQPGYVTDAKINALYHNGGGFAPTVVVATLPAGTTVASPAALARSAAVFDAAARAVPGSRVADLANTGDRRFAAANGRTTFALVFTPLPTSFGSDKMTPTITAAAARAAPAGWRTGVTGWTQLQLATGNSSSKGTTTLVEVTIGSLGALAVLLFVFASFLALVPLMMAAVAIPSTFLLVDGLTYLTSVSMLVEYLIALIGLGVAIDYSLLVVTRWRENRDGGAANTEAVTQAMGSAGHAVVFSGLTVAVSLLALLVVPVPFLRNMGVAGFFIPLVSIAVATTLLPVLLATLGPALDHPRLRHEVHASRPWSAWARLVLRHRKTAAVAGAAVLVALIVPLASIRLGEPAASALAQHGPAHRSLASLNAGGVPTGVITPMEVLVRSGAATAVAREVAAVPGVYSAVAPRSFSAGGTAIVDVLAAAQPSSTAGTATITGVQRALRGLPGVIGVGGAGPTQVDFIHAVYGSFPLMLALIALVTFVLLARAFRSVVLAAKAVIFNLVSVGAAYGTMVIIWQYGAGSKALWGVPATGSITVWVPIMVFAFLFGLSMDYEVFILSRMRESYDASGSTDTAVVTGIGRTGRLVTSAALILFLSFLSMSTAPGTDVKVLATGLGAGILLDAVVVRCLLVPALVGVLGRWNWWMPAAAARVLRVTPSPLPEGRYQ
jgi:RND superfamily putative drug exporter